MLTTLRAYKGNLRISVKTYRENLTLIKIVDFCRVSTIDFQGMAKLKLVAKDYEYLMLTEVDESIYQSLEKSQVLEISSVLGMV